MGCYCPAGSPEMVEVVGSNPRPKVSQDSLLHAWQKFCWIPWSTWYDISELGWLEAEVRLTCQCISVMLSVTYFNPMKESIIPRSQINKFALDFLCS